MREGWTYKRLSEVCDKGASNIVINKLEDNNGAYPLFGASGLVKNVDFYHQDKPYIGIVKDGAGVGRVNTYPAYSSLVGTMQYIFPKEECLLNYIKYFLIKLDLSHCVSGATIPHIYFKDYGKSLIPVPPLSEQQSIVAELDKINELISLKKSQMNDLDALAQSIFYDMFGDPVVNEKGWEMKPWKQLLETKLGKMLDKAKQDVNAKLFPYLANLNVQWGYFDLSDIRTMPFSEQEMEKFRLKDGDLMICEGGESGRCAIWKATDNDMFFQKAVHRARVIDKSVTNIVYIRYLLEYTKKGDGLKDYITKSTIEHLTGEKLNKLPIPLPPLPLQQSFAAKIEAIERQKQQVKQSLKDLETLLASRMQYWFEEE